MIGEKAKVDSIEIVPYDPRWPSLFETERDAIQGALQSFFPVTLHHIGSTAVPGLAAKPIIDIFVEIPSFDQASQTIEPLERLGYECWKDNPEKDHLFFVKGRPPRGTGRTHHVHIFRSAAKVREHLAFRDHLRAHPDEALRYETLKRDLANRFRENREAYTNGKDEYVRMVLKKADRS